MGLMEKAMRNDDLYAGEGRYVERVDGYVEGEPIIVGFSGARGFYMETKSGEILKPMTRKIRPGDEELDEASAPMSLPRRVCEIQKGFEFYDKEKTQPQKVGIGEKQEEGMEIKVDARNNVEYVERLGNVDVKGRVVIEEKGMEGKELLSGLEGTSALVGRNAVEVFTVSDIVNETGLAERTVRRAIQELGYSKNGVKSALTKEEAEAVKKHLQANMSYPSGRYKDEDIVNRLQNDTAFKLAAFDARVEEIKEEGLGKTMTVKEVAKALGVTDDTIINSIKALESQSEKIRFGKIQGTHGGKPAYALTEADVTAVKLNLEKRYEAKTELEKELLIQQAMMFQQEKITKLQADKEALQIKLDEHYNWCSIRRWNIERNGSAWDLHTCQRAGKNISRHCRENGIAIKKAVDPVFGEVNVYPPELIEKWAEGYEHYESFGFEDDQD
jgi:predicted transcriptional regulator